MTNRRIPTTQEHDRCQCGNQNHVAYSAKKNIANTTYLSIQPCDQQRSQIHLQPRQMDGGWFQRYQNRYRSQTSATVATSSKTRNPTVVGEIPFIWPLTTSVKFKPDTIKNHDQDKTHGDFVRKPFARKHASRPRTHTLELEAQPAMMMPYTSIEVIAMINNKPALTFANTISGPNGTTDHAAKAGIIVIIGANTNKTLFAFAGTTISLSRSLSASAIGCNKPGTYAFWTRDARASNRSSYVPHKVRYATAPSKAVRKRS